MVEKLAQAVTDRLVENGYIRSSEQDEYIYVIVIKLEKWLAIALVMLLGWYFHIAISTLFFLLFIFPVRTRSGGFHATSFGMCMALTLGAYIVFAIFLMPHMIRNMNVTFIVLMMSVIVLELIGAVNHPNMNWSKDEIKEIKSSARLIVMT